MDSGNGFVNYLLLTIAQGAMAGNNDGWAPHVAGSELFRSAAVIRPPGHSGRQPAGKLPRWALRPQQREEEMQRFLGSKTRAISRVFSRLLILRWGPGRAREREQL